MTGDMDVNRGKLEALSAYLMESPKAFVKRFGGAVVGRKLPEVLNTGLMGYEEINPYFGIMTVVKKSTFDFELEDWVDLKGINCALYADDQERNKDGVNVGAVHEKYGLQDGGIVVVRPDGYGALFAFLIFESIVDGCLFWQSASLFLSMNKVGPPSRAISMASSRSANRSEFCRICRMDYERSSQCNY